jgi:hypothetical protein
MALSGCATELPVAVAEADVSGTLVVGRVVTTITGESQRVYSPELRSFELINTESEERFKVYVKSEDEFFRFPFLLDTINLIVCKSAKVHSCPWRNSREALCSSLTS